MGAGRQLLLQDDELIYDSVGNPTEIRDWRIASEWPAGAKPVTKKAQYDDLYRVSRVDYQYEGGDDTWTSPFAAENGGQADLQDPRRAKPSPHVDFAKRLQWQTFSYDWLGNTSKTDDDAHGFYNRSLGPIANDTSKPYQLKTADNTALGGGKTGKLATQYDASGNLTRMHVQRAGACLPANADCSQVFDYQWDEVGRLARARRWDVATLPPMSDLPPDADVAADLRYGYDAGDQRVLKTAVDDALNERHTVYVFESLELRRAVFAAGPGPSEVPDYERSKWTEVPYLYAHGVRLARVAWNQPELPTVGGKQLHVLLELGDHLGSTSVVLDQATGELVERGTYQAYGGAESDYRPERWKAFREDYRFTGKEEDVEVGLQYFGARFYAPLLNRWISPDPLGVHFAGETDFNLYAYVSGKALKAIDPLGLQSNEGGTGQPGHSQADLNSQQHPNTTPSAAPGPDTGSHGAGGGGPGAPNMSEPEPNFTPGAGGAASQFYGGTRGAGGQSHGGPPIAKPSQTPTAGEIILMTPLGAEAAVAGTVRGAAAAARAGSAAWRTAKEAQLAQGLARLERATVGRLQALAADNAGAIRLPGTAAAVETSALKLVPAPYRASVGRAFAGPPQAVTLTEDLVVYRHWGGAAKETGSPWYSVKVYAKAGNAKRYLALPEANTARNVTAFRIPAGTTVLRGKVAAQVGEVGFGERAVGGGTQIYLPDPKLAEAIR